MVTATYPIERRLGELADTVESAYQRYGEKARLREPLKDSFTLTLTLVLLLSLFASLYGAFWAARRLVRPIQDLVAMIDQGRQQSELQRRQADLAFADHDLALCLVDTKEPIVVHRRAIDLPALGPAKQGGDTGGQLHRRERLDDVVVRSVSQSSRTLGVEPARGQHDDRYL